MSYTTSKEIQEIAKLRAQHFHSLLVFVKTFFKLRTGREFELSEPMGRESHYITVAKALERVIRGECHRLVINIPPRYGKTELLIHFVAWAMARYPDSNFLYVSYSHSLAKRQTQTIRDIITLPQYKACFGVGLKDDTTAKDNFAIEQGGSVYAAGAQGTITGFGAGINGCDRFGGCIVIDDIHKPDEVTSDTIREGTIDWYYNTLQSRLNSPNTPIIFIGQRLHEHDLSAVLLETKEWETVVIPSIDEAGNALHPKMHDLKTLKRMEEQSPYNFASQYQQNPQPAGGGIFKADWFVKMEIEPNILCTFMVVDAAETEKTYNDATAMSFFGLYKIRQFDVETNSYGLHWIDCREIRVEPKDLQAEFYGFYRDCMTHAIKPQIAVIEKKSVGVSLVSVMKEVQGLRIMEVNPSKASENKIQRFLNIQPYIAAKRISLPEYGYHTNLTIEHCRKITANNTHAHDDIADTLAYAVKLALIDEVIVRKTESVDYNAISKTIMSQNNAIDRLKRARYGR